MIEPNGNAMQEKGTSKTYEEILNEHGVLVYTVVGFSMMPLLRQRKDIIQIRPIHSRPKKYDVVLYKRGNKYILHRIIRVLQEGYVIAGDHNTFKEYDVKDPMILGSMTRIIRDGKSITTENILYKMYYHLWVDFYPVRVFLIRGKYVLRRLLSLIYHRRFDLIRKKLGERLARRK